MCLFILLIFVFSRGNILNLTNSNLTLFFSFYGLCLVLYLKIVLLQGHEDFFLFVILKKFYCFAFTFRCIIYFYLIFNICCKNLFIFVCKDIKLFNFRTIIFILNCLVTFIRISVDYIFIGLSLDFLFSSILLHFLTTAAL